MGLNQWVDAAGGDIMTPDAEYTVRWSMRFAAEGPIDAAQQALGVQRDPESIATVFFVIDQHGNQFRVDLDADGSVNYVRDEHTGEYLEDNR